jgi:hypothetical protein
MACSPWSVLWFGLDIIINGMDPSWIGQPNALTHQSRSPLVRSTEVDNTCDDNNPCTLDTCVDLLSARHLGICTPSCLSLLAPVLVIFIKIRVFALVFFFQKKKKEIEVWRISRFFLIPSHFCYCVHFVYEIE